MAGYLQPALPIDCPEAHGRAIHPRGRPGRVFVGRKLANGRWRQSSYPVEVLEEVLRACHGQDDVYLSMQRFFGTRTIADLGELGALFADVDYYRKPALADLDPRSVLDEALSALRRAQKPAPSLAVASGRGLYLVWFHEPVPRAALPRWKACQEELYEVLEAFGADGGALDAARVLRIVGTRHGKTGVVVEALTPAGEVWGFEDLAREVLPLTRAEVADLRVRRAEKDGGQLPLFVPPKDFTQATLWEARLADLQRLLELKPWGRHGTPISDFRDRWLFIAGVAMSWLCVPEAFDRELERLAEQVGGWGEKRTHSKLSQIFTRVKAAVAGERLSYAGTDFDPRYHFKNETIIRWLEITPDEQRELKTIISDDERRRRDRGRKREERRRSGEVQMTREEYEGRAEDRRTEALRLYEEEGLKASAIAKRLGISRGHAYKLLKPEAEIKGVASVSD